MTNIEYYNRNSREYFEETINADMSFWRDKFIMLLPAGGRVLDAGCGSGRDSKVFIQQGFSVVSIDASSELCKLASQYLSQEVWQMRFEEMSFTEEFDGVWACASLLHISYDDIFDILKKIYNSLQVDGIFYVSLKQGEGVTFDGERIFYLYTKEKALSLFSQAKFEVIQYDESKDVLQGRENNKWINILCKKGL